MWWYIWKYIWSHHCMANRRGNNGNSERLYFLASRITADGDCSLEIKRHFLLGRKTMTNLDSVSKSRDIADQKSYGFSSSHVWMWELDHKEGWAKKNWCFQTVVLEKILESPLDCSEINPVSPKGNWSWIFIGRTDAEAPIVWPPDMKIRLIEKDHDDGKDWRQEKGMTENKMVGWYHWFNGHEFEQALGEGEGQGSLACCSPWGCKESDMTERLNWTEFFPTVYSEISIYKKIQITLMNRFTNNPRWALLWLLPRPRIRWKPVQQQGKYNWETLQREGCQECWWMGLTNLCTRFF